jgi:hypothetical protein
MEDVRQCFEGLSARWPSPRHSTPSSKGQKGAAGAQASQPLGTTHLTAKHLKWNLLSFFHVPLKALAVQFGGSSGAGGKQIRSAFGAWVMLIDVTAPDHAKRYNFSNL